MILKKEHFNSLKLLGFSLRHCRKQLIKASGSVGANYIEANESLGKKDFSMRIKISRKEAKESAYWLRVIHETNKLENVDDAQSLIQEANELKKIFSSILEKSK
jgi:four helix bundle protein